MWPDGEMTITNWRREGGSKHGRLTLAIAFLVPEARLDALPPCLDPLLAVHLRGHFLHGCLLGLGHRRNGSK